MRKLLPNLSSSEEPLSEKTALNQRARLGSNAKNLPMIHHADTNLKQTPAPVLKAIDIGLKSVTQTVLATGMFKPTCFRLTPLSFAH